MQKPVGQGSSVEQTAISWYDRGSTKGGKPHEGSAHYPAEYSVLVRTAFRYGCAVCALPKDVQTRWFDPNRRFFTVSDWEMRVFRKIGLPNWKDRLPQFNPEFDKRHLKSGRDTAYLDRFLFITCRAEVIHYVIGVLGWVSLVFCLLSADRTAWLIRYAVIALAIQLANLPFAWIHRYNRIRLLSVRKRLSFRIEI